MSLFTIPSLYILSFFLPGYNSPDVTYNPSTTASALIDGYVKTKNNAPVANAVVYLADNADFAGAQLTTTNAAGYYAFNGVEEGKDYFLKVSKNDDHKNGISVVDLVKIQRHLLNIDPFNSLDQFIAADANNSQHVSAIDLIEIRKLLLGLYTSLPNNTSWKFVAQPADLSDLNATLTSIKIIDDLNTDHVQADFVGIKIGDL